jgi:DUF4097 and DUF4098 domain-containing protein YvlB
MQTFETPEPISVSLDLGVGDVVLAASDRDDTVVEVEPSDPTRSRDMAAADATEVRFANGTLTITGPKWKWALRGGDGSVDVRIELPEGSAVRGTTGVASVRATGRLGECRLRNGAGPLTFDETGPAELQTGAGDITIDALRGRADLKTAGVIRVGRIDGPAAIRNSNGDTWVGEAAGEARVTAANGAISVDVVRAGIVAKTANGNVRLAEVAGGHVVAESAFGGLEIGVSEDLAAWLDLRTRFGRVLSELDEAEAPEPGQDAVEIRARTSMGDIAIRRASVTSAGTEWT